MKKGFALIAVLTVAIVVGLGIVTIIQLVMNNATLSQMSEKAIQAQYVAEAGLQKAIYECRNGNTTSPTILTEDLGNGLIMTANVTKTLNGTRCSQLDATVSYL